MTTQVQATLTFESDITIWGASLWGESDPSVLVAEYGDHYYNRGPLWDVFGPSTWMRSVGDSDYEPVPLFWSLSWVHRFRLDRLAEGSDDAD